MLTRAAARTHMVQFHAGDDDLLVTKTGHYLFEGWRSGEGLLAAGTGPRNRAIADQLSALGLNVAAEVNARRLVFLEAEDLADRLTIAGRPDWKSFDALIGTAIRELRGGSGKARAYGEIVGVLWSRGQREGAARLEEHWNRLIGSSDLTLLCAYPIDVLGEELGSPEVDTIVCLHTHMLPVGADGRLEEAVGRAMLDILGERARRLRKLVDTHFRPSLAAVPKAEGMVVWIRKNLPQYAERIFDRAREYYRAA